MEQLSTTCVNKRQEEKARNKMIKDLYFLVNWVGENDKMDVVAAKEVVPPEDTDILDVSAGMICRVSYSSKFYAARVMKSGLYAEIKRQQLDQEKEVESEEGEGTEEGASPEEGTNSGEHVDVDSQAEKLLDSRSVVKTEPAPKPADNLPRKSPRKVPPKKSSLNKAATSRKEIKDWTASRKRKNKSKELKNMLFDFEMGSDMESLGEEKQEDSSPLCIDDLFGTTATNLSTKVFAESVPARPPSKLAIQSASKQWQETHFGNGDDSGRDEHEQGSKRQKMDLQYGTSLINQLQDRVGELEKTTKLLSSKLKQQTKEISSLKSATGSGSASGSASGSTTRCSSPDNTDAIIPSAAPKPVCSITRDKDKIKICGRMVDNLKYQSAILPKDAGKCALQLLDCLFDTTELVNGNPSGQTNSKDPARKLSIRQLDPDRMKYIYDFIKGKWPDSRSQVLRKITQKCTDLYNNRKDLRVTSGQ